MIEEANVSEEKRSPSEQITDTVTAWPGVEAGYGKRGEWGFYVKGHEVGHLHGDRAAHFALGKELGESLRERGMVVDHPVFPGKSAMAARGIEDQADVDEVIELMRINYDRVVARYGLPERSAA
jgi:hypothetical protein